MPRVKSMLSLKRNGNSLAMSIFQAFPQAYIYLLYKRLITPGKCQYVRIDIYCRVHANIVCHRELRLRISHRRDTAIDGFIIRVMRHCPMAGRRHNTAVLRYNEGNVGAAIVTPLYIRCAKKNFLILS